MSLVKSWATILTSGAASDAGGGSSDDASGHQEFRRDIHAEATEEVMRYCKVSSVPLPIKIFNYLQFKVLQIYYTD